MIVRRFYAKGVDKHRYSLSEPWLRIAAADTVLDIVNGYAGQPTRLTYVDNWYTVPRPEVTERVASQRWHRDPEDDHIVKMFIYFSDVDEEAGPFEYVRDSAAGGKYGDVFPWGQGHRYPSAEELEAAVDPDDRLTMTGPAGTVDLLRHRRLPPRRLRPHQAADPDDLDLPARECPQGQAPLRGRLRGPRELALGAGPARTGGLARDRSRPAQGSAE